MLCSPKSAVPTRVRPKIRFEDCGRFRFRLALPFHVDVGNTRQNDLLALVCKKKKRGGREKKDLLGARPGLARQRASGLWERRPGLKVPPRSPVPPLGPC